MAFGYSSDVITLAHPEVGDHQSRRQPWRYHQRPPLPLRFWPGEICVGLRLCYERTIFLAVVVEPDGGWLSPPLRKVAVVALVAAKVTLCSYALVLSKYTIRYSWYKQPLPGTILVSEAICRFRSLGSPIASRVGSSSTATLPPSTFHPYGRVSIRRLWSLSIWRLQGIVSSWRRGTLSEILGVVDSRNCTS